MVAVVWDCDGVLVDSEPHSVAAWMAVLPRYGSPAGPSDVAACTGLGFGPTFTHLASLGSAVPYPPAAELWGELLAALEESFAGGLLVFQDALGAVRAAGEAGVPQAVATTSPRARLDATLRAAGLTGFFGATAAGDEVREGKPAPDVYLLAAARLGVTPGECVAVEDTGFGVRAARAAGMRTFGIVREERERSAMAAAGAEIVDRIDPALLLG